MKNITMYTGPMCNFCEAAKRLFSRNNLKYQEIDISSKEGLRDEMIKKANGKRTIPQIFFDAHHVGGYVELRDLVRSDGDINCIPLGSLSNDNLIEIICELMNEFDIDLRELED